VAKLGGGIKETNEQKQKEIAKIEYNNNLKIEREKQGDNKRVFAFAALLYAASNTW
jgi:hypothetical protein